MPASPRTPLLPPPRRWLLAGAFGLGTMALMTLMTRAVAADPPVETVVVKAVAHFDFDDPRVRGDDRAALLAEVGKIKDVSWQTVTATGHTDSVGTVAYNQRLSQRRAEAVKGYLVSQGLSASMIRVRGLAAEQPVAPNDSAEGRAQNRRTEVEFQGVRVAAK